MLNMVGAVERCVATITADARLASIDTSGPSQPLLTAWADGHCSIGFSRNMGPVNQKQLGWAVEVRIPQLPANRDQLGCKLLECDAIELQFSFPR